jgi:hypothetical protein
MRPLKTLHCCYRLHGQFLVVRLRRRIHHDGRARRTCQTKGRFFRFSSAKATASRRNMLPDTPVPSRSVNRCRNEGMPAMAKIPAAMERVPPTWGRR